MDAKIVPITVDGLDATVNIVNILKDWEVDAVLLGGATFAGFNVVDVGDLFNEVGRPIVVYMSRYPDMEATLNALKKHFPDWEERWRRYELLGEIHEMVAPNGLPVIYEVYEGTTEFAEKVLTEQSVHGRIPEALRLADLIAKGTSPVFLDPAGTGHGSSS